MKKTLGKILSAVLLGFIALGLLASSAEAATMSFRASSAVVHLGQQIAVDVLLDPQGANVNTIGVTIFIPENLTFVGADDSTSIIGLWVDEPSYLPDQRMVSFSGIIPGGFSGMIDPFSPNERKPGTLIRLILKGLSPGAATSSFSETEAYVNDGFGTRTRITTTPISIVVDNLIGEDFNEFIVDEELPLDFVPILQRDLLLYDGKFVLIFNTKDKESGMSHYEVKEGDGDWVVATSPYLLKDQKLASKIRVKAVDRAGNERIVVIDTPFHLSVWQVVCLSLLGLALAYAIMHYFKKRKEAREAAQIAVLKKKQAAVEAELSRLKESKVDPDNSSIN